MSDIDILNDSLAGEHFGIAAYDAALNSGLLDAETIEVARAFQSDHQTHRNLLDGLVAARGGEPAAALTDDAYATQFPPLTTAAAIVAYAIELESAAARASIASVAKYEDRDLAVVAARIGAVEAQHWAALLAATSQHPVPEPVISLDAT